MTPTPTPTPVELANASNNFATGFGSTTGLGGVIVVLLYIVGALLAAQFVAPWLARSNVLTAASRRLVASLVYAIKGLAASAVLVAIALPVYLFAQADESTQGVALEAIAAIVAGYLALVVVGWLADQAITRFIDAHPDYDEWADLFPDEEDDEPALADGGERP